MLMIRRVDLKDVADMIPFVVEYLDRALALCSDEHDTETVGLELLSGELDLWLVYDSAEKQLKGCVTTGFLQYPLKWSLEVRTVTIDAPREEWVPLFDDIEHYAAVHGCETIEAYGRKGWRKIGDVLGLKESQVKFVKQVGK